MFTGSPHFDDEGEEHVPEEPVRYVGKPTGEVDDAWDRLTDGELAAGFRIICIRGASLKFILIVVCFYVRKADTFSYQRKRPWRRGGMTLSSIGMTIGEGILSGRPAMTKLLSDARRRG